MVSKKIVVVGSINLDLVANVARMPEPGETLPGSSFAIYPGGKGANQAAGAERIGADVVMIGRLGTDSFTETLRRGLVDADVDTHSVKSVSTASGVAPIIVTDGGGDSILVVPGANADLSRDTLEQYLGKFRDAAVILAKCKIPIAFVVRLARIAADFCVPIILDPAPARTLPAELLSPITWLTPNESETQCILEQLGFKTAEAYGSAEWLEEAAKRILRTVVSYVASRLGACGAYLAGEKMGTNIIPCIPMTALDTTAAGDAYNAGLAYAFTQELDSKSAVQFAGGVAAISVTRRGVQHFIPPLTQVTELLTAHGFDNVLLASKGCVNHSHKRMDLRSSSSRFVKIHNRVLCRGVLSTPHTSVGPFLKSTVNSRLRHDFSVVHQLSYFPQRFMSRFLWDVVKGCYCLLCIPRLQRFPSQACRGR